MWLAPNVSPIPVKSKVKSCETILINANFSFQNQILQLQNAITKLKIENETLKKQIDTLEATVTRIILIQYMVVKGSTCEANSPPKFC